MGVVTWDAPPAAAGQPLFVDFVNTLHWYEGTPIELIGTDAEFTDWLAEHGLGARDAVAWLPAVLQLRVHARAVTEALATRRTPPEADMAALHTALGGPIGRLTLAGSNTPRPRLAF